MRMRDLRIKLRVEIENEMRVFLESLNFEIKMRVSQKSATKALQGSNTKKIWLTRTKEDDIFPFRRVIDFR